jgi:radical SAM superfamily enzyme YgiQ (UPF0313 family)
MVDILITSIPYIAYTAPAAAPAALKGHLISQGFTAKAIDLNIEFRNSVIATNSDILPALVNYWCTIDKKPELPEDVKSIYSDLLDHWAKKLCETDTAWIGLSVFSAHSYHFLVDILEHIQKFNHKKIKLVVGGYGLDVIFIESLSHLIDYYILGEGEFALINLLKGNLDYPGINSTGTQILDLDSIGFPDYSDYNLSDNYQNWYDGPMIQVTGSRGCVRNCSFCNVGAIWEKYKYRSGATVAQEIIENHKKTGINHFYFTDSLINGNLRELMVMMRTLAEYKQTTGSKLTWGGQWITRSQRGLPKDYYQLIKASGGYNITMGVETGSDVVRAHMKKNFTNNDLDSEMEMFSKHRITVGFFMILGYPTETEQDFFDTLDMFKRYTKYVADGTLIGIAIGRGYISTKNIPMNSLNIVEDMPGGKWKSKVTKSNYLENIRRRIIAQKVLQDHGWPSSDLDYELRSLFHLIPGYFNSTTKAEIAELLVSKNINIPDQFQMCNSPKSYDVELQLEGNPGLDSYPYVEIVVNNKQYYSGFVQGQQCIKFTVDDKRKRNLLQISMTNKTNVDTVIENGKIIKDKSIKFEYFLLDGIRIPQDILYLQGCVKNSNHTKEKSAGLYKNSKFLLYFENPTSTYFIKKHRYYFTEQYKDSGILNKLSDLFSQHTQ